MIDVIDNEDAFDSLKEEWQRLEQNPDLRIFQTFAWCRAAWKHYLSIDKRNRLWILRWHQDGKEDVVIFPFYVDAKSRLRFIMDTHSDVCDSVYMGDLNRHWAYKEAADFIIKDGRIKSIFFQKMVGDSESLNYFSILFPGAIVSRDNAFSWVESERTDNFVAGQKQLKRKDRDRLKAILRGAANQELKIFSQGSYDPFPKDIILSLRASMVGRFRANTYFLTDEMISFAKELYEYGKMELATLRNEGLVNALAFRLLKQPRINYWIVLYRDAHLTTELYLRYMQHKASVGPQVFDFGVGAYGYKLGTYRPKLGITFSMRYAKNILRHFQCLLLSNVRLVKDMLKPRLRRH